jgi:hypothetical protein
MSISRIIGAVIIAFTTTFAIAQESEVILGFDLGHSDFAPDSSFGDVPDDFHGSGFSLGYIAGYRWGNQVVLEANMATATNTDAFLFGDSGYFETLELKLMGGYSFKINDSLYIVPLIGLNDWELDTREETPSFERPESTRIRYKGTDLTYKIRFDLPINELLKLSASFSRSHFNIGKMTNVQLGLKFEF